MIMNMYMIFFVFLSFFTRNHGKNMKVQIMNRKRSNYKCATSCYIINMCLLI